MDMKNGINDRIKALRKNLNMTQKQLATLVDVSPQVVSNWERGYTPNIDNEDLLKLAYALKTTAEYLVSGNKVVADIQEQKKPNDLLKFLDQSEVMFDGVPLTEEDKARVKAALEVVFWDAKTKNKRK